MNKFSLLVRSGNLTQMLVNNLASFKVLMIEVADDEFAASDVGQEFLLGDLSVLSVTLDEVLLFLLIVILHLGHSPLAEVPHHLSLFVVKHLIIFVLVLMMLVE